MIEQSPLLAIECDSTYLNASQQSPFEMLVGEAAESTAKPLLWRERRSQAFVFSALLDEIVEAVMSLGPESTRKLEQVTIDASPHILVELFRQEQMSHAFQTVLVDRQAPGRFHMGLGTSIGSQYRDTKAVERLIESVSQVVPRRSAFVLDLEEAAVVYWQVDSKMKSSQYPLADAYIERRGLDYLETLPDNGAASEPSTIDALLDKFSSDYPVD